jgi:hypothetical protein
LASKVVKIVALPAGIALLGRGLLHARAAQQRRPNVSPAGTNALADLVGRKRLGSGQPEVEVAGGRDGALVDDGVVVQHGLGPFRAFRRDCFSKQPTIDGIQQFTDGAKLVENCRGGLGLKLKDLGCTHRGGTPRRSMSEYVARLIQNDADTVGLSEFLSTKTPDEPTAVPGGGR